MFHKMKFFHSKNGLNFTILIKAVIFQHNFVRIITWLVTKKKRKLHDSRKKRVILFVIRTHLLCFKVLFGLARVDKNVTFLCLPKPPPREDPLVVIGW